MFSLLLRLENVSHGRWWEGGQMCGGCSNPESKRPGIVCAVPCWAPLYLKDYLLFSVNVVWAGETAALCLRWMDPDSSTTSVWKPMPGLNGFPLLISSSVSICSGSLPHLVSYTPSLPLLQPFFFHKCNKAAFLSLFSFPKVPSLHVFLFLPLPLNILPWEPRYCRERRRRVRQLARFITCYLDSKTYDCVAST